LTSPSKRSRSSHSSDDDRDLESTTQGDLGDDDLGVDPVARQVERKRRQNTVAARRSRRRKLERLQGLEETIQKLTEENESLKRENAAHKAYERLHGLETLKVSDDWKMGDPVQKTGVGSSGGGGVQP
jgi:membrane protein involved in colicin uptake